MSELYLIGDKAVQEMLEMPSVIAGVEEIYRLKSTNEAGVFPVITHEWIQGLKDMDIKSGYIGGDIHIYGLKALTYIESNDKKGLPRLNGTMMIFDSDNGQLKGIIDSRSVTGLRTGAAGSIGSKYLAREDSTTLLLVGTGNQAFFNLAGNLLTMDSIKRVLAYDPIAPEMAESFVKTAKVRLSDGILKKNKELVEKISLEKVDSLEVACGQADIITTITPSLSPLVMKEWVRPGTHINCIGADMAEKQEIDGGLLSKAKVVVDDILQSTTLGELEVSIKKGDYQKEKIHGEIGSVISGDIEGRISDEEITVFDTTGLALQDLIVASILIDKADKLKMEKVDL